MKLALTLGVMLACMSSIAQQTSVATKANVFLSSLDSPLKSKALYKLDDEERFNWHFVPKARNGVCFRDLNRTQADAAWALLKESLSKQGYSKASAIVQLENILRVVENRSADDKYRDPLNYYITVFGDPGKDKAWGWRFEGHHVALNFISADNKIQSSTPSFFGSNPGIVNEGPERGKQILKQESDGGFHLVNALTAEQRKTALIAETAPNDILSFNSRTATVPAPAGLSYTAMNKEQQNIFMELLNVYVNNYELGFADKLMSKIKNAGFENLSFCWAGSLKPGGPYYYRIQGPMLLIELDNTQNNANHIHSVVRDLTNDFGADILREHYEREHSTK